MDSVEEAKEYNNNSCSSSCYNNASNNEQGTHAIVKRKRTKRRRFHLPPTSSASSAEFSSGITEEDEDMANCLMLLSRGRNGDPGPESPVEEGVDRGGATEKNTSQKYAEAAATTTDGKHIGLYAYECKTCNKCFPSFQALGGHRASHKKPKTGIPMEEKKAVVDQDGVGLSLSSLSKPDVVPSDGNYVVSGGSNKMRVHECSICGSEFPSGQALGGHMRRHRPLMTTTETPELKKERSVLSLDLNLPAPSDDDREELPTFPTSTSVAFPFESKQLALVDCHY